MVVADRQFQGIAQISCAVEVWWSALRRPTHQFDNLFFFCVSWKHADRSMTIKRLVQDLSS
jgi:hypothetical protein